MHAEVSIMIVDCCQECGGLYYDEMNVILIGLMKIFIRKRDVPGCKQGVVFSTSNAKIDSRSSGYTYFGNIRVQYDRDTIQIRRRQSKQPFSLL